MRKKLVERSYDLRFMRDPSLLPSLYSSTALILLNSNTNHATNYRELSRYADPIIFADSGINLFPSLPQFPLFSKALYHIGDMDSKSPLPEGLPPNLSCVYLPSQSSTDIHKSLSYFTGLPSSGGSLVLISGMSGSSRLDHFFSNISSLLYFSSIPSSATSFIGLSGNALLLPVPSESTCFVLGVENGPWKVGLTPLAGIWEKGQISSKGLKWEIGLENIGVGEPNGVSVGNLTDCENGRVEVQNRSAVPGIMVLEMVNEKSK